MISSTSPAPAVHALSSRPLGLWLALAYTAMAAVVGGSAGVGLMTGAMPVLYGGEPIPGAATDLLGLLLVVNAVPAAALAYGLLRQRAWTRPGLLGWVAMMSASSVLLNLRVEPALGGLIGILGVLTCIGLWLYLYRKHSVVAYYQSRTLAARVHESR